MNRPSHKEIQGKLREARAAVRNEKVFLIDQETIAEDAIELGYDIGSELLHVVADLLQRRRNERDEVPQMFLPNGAQEAA